MSNQSNQEQRVSNQLEEFLATEELDDEQLDAVVGGAFGGSGGFGGFGGSGGFGGPGGVPPVAQAVNGLCPIGCIAVNGFCYPMH